MLSLTPSHTAQVLPALSDLAIGLSQQLENFTYEYEEKRTKIKNFVTDFANRFLTTFSFENLTTEKMVDIESITQNLLQTKNTVDKKVLSNYKKLTQYHLDLIVFMQQTLNKFTNQFDNLADKQNHYIILKSVVLLETELERYHSLLLNMQNIIHCLCL